MADVLGGNTSNFTKLLSPPPAVECVKLKRGLMALCRGPSLLADCCRVSPDREYNNKAPVGVTHRNCGV